MSSFISKKVSRDVTFPGWWIKSAKIRLAEDGTTGGVLDFVVVG